MLISKPYYGCVFHFCERERMFGNEKGMNKPVAQWMKSLHLTVKQEFITPGGICDLVGLSFSSSNVHRRLKLRQTRPISSIVRSALLMQIPDSESGQSISIQKLIKNCTPAVSPITVVSEIERLIKDHFVIGSTKYLQKRNGWVPLWNRLIAVELKLKRIEEAMSQARNNMIFAAESYVALPCELARKVAAKPEKWPTLLEGVGLIAVSKKSCKVLKPASVNASLLDPIVQFYVVEKFWSTHSKDN